jgi:hypothetical protein
MPGKKRGVGVDLILAIVLALLLILWKDSLAPLIFWAGWVGVILFLFNATVRRPRKKE